jgi:hypothetical protein
MIELLKNIKIFKMNIKRFENYKVVNKNDLDNNLSAEYYLNKEKGKKPYIKKKGKIIEVDIKKTIPKNAIYLKPEDAKKLNDIANDIEKLQKQYDDILK